MDSFTAALGRLDPANRALLDLSLRRGLRPEEIADMLGTDPESVIVAREQALEQLADEVGMEDAGEIDPLRARLAELPAEAWTPGAAPEPERANRPSGDEVQRRVEAARVAGAKEPAELPKPKKAAADTEPSETKRRGRLPLLLVLLAIVAIAFVVAMVAGGDDDKPSATATTPTSAETESAETEPQPTAPEPEPEPEAPKPRQVRLAPVAGGNAAGTASLAEGGKRLILKVTGLRPGTYQVWLYNSVIEARSIGQAKGSKLDLGLRLPPAANDFRSIDVSREPPDGNPNHSGESVLRVSLKKLSR